MRRPVFLDRAASVVLDPGNAVHDRAAKPPSRSARRVPHLQILRVGFLTFPFTTRASVPPYPPSRPLVPGLSIEGAGFDSMSLSVLGISPCAP